ncbi:MAG: transposase, partial [Sulfurifustis sp.]
LLNKAGPARKRNAWGEYDVWQRRYWEHLIRDEADFERHVNYIHYNPVKHACVVRPGDWRWSSFHRFVRLGLIPPTWTSDPGEGGYGE